MFQEFFFCFFFNFILCLCIIIIFYILFYILFHGIRNKGNKDMFVEKKNEFFNGEFFIYGSLFCGMLFKIFFA